MADNRTTLDIVIRMLAEGQGAKVTKEQLDDLVKSEKELAAAAESPAQQRKLENTRATIAAVRELNPELETQKKTVTESEVETVKETAATEKQIDAKKQLGESLKGLALQFPGLAQAMRLVTNPAGATIAALGGIVYAMTDYIRMADELAVRASEMGKMGEGYDVGAAISRSVNASRAAFQNSFADIRASVNSVNAALEQTIRYLLLQQRLAEKVADAELDAKIASIDRQRAEGKITGAAANEQIAAAQNAAKAEKQERALAGFPLEIAATKAAVDKKAREIEDQKRADTGMDAKIETLKRRVDDITTEKARVNTLSEEIKPLTDALAIAQEFARTGNGGLSATWDAFSNTRNPVVQPGRTSQTDWATLMDASAGRADERKAAALRLESDIQDRLAQIAQMRKLVGEKLQLESDKLTAATKEQASIQGKINAGETERLQLVNRLQELERQYVEEKRAALDAGKFTAASEADRAAAARAEATRKQLILERQREAQEIDTKLITDPMNPDLIRAKARLQGQINDLQNFGPENQGLNRARRGFLDAEAEQRVREMIERARQRDGHGSIAPALGPVASNISAGNADTLAAVNTLMGVTRKMAAEAAQIRRDVHDLATRVDTMRG